MRPSGKVARDDPGHRAAFAKPGAVAEHDAAARLVDLAFLLAVIDEFDALRMGVYGVDDAFELGDGEAFVHLVRQAYGHDRNRWTYARERSALDECFRVRLCAVDVEIRRILDEDPFVFALRWRCRSVCDLAHVAKRRIVRAQLTFANLDGGA